MPVLDSIHTREQAVEFLEGYALDRRDELDQRSTAAPLLKSYLLETTPQPERQSDLPYVFGAAGLRLDVIDDSLFKVWSPTLLRYIGMAELLIPRYPVFYTNEHAKDADVWVRDFVDATPLLDRLWLSGRTFYKLWATVVRINPGTRYGRIVFEHESVFEGSTDRYDSEEPEADEAEPEEAELAQVRERAEGDQPVRERRTSRFAVVDRLDVLSRKLPTLRGIYEPLYSISQLRFPSIGRGGHDFYYNGKVTNRSDNFADHRAHLLYVLKVYKDATESAERAAWYEQETVTAPSASSFTTLRGAPVVLRFSTELPQAVFDQLVRSTFGRKQNRFRLWGVPIFITPSTVHVYGADRHLWQPIFLEITRRHLVAVLPRGTCGNTIHRLVSNVQRFVDPSVSAWVGDQPYDDLIGSATDRQRGDVHDRSRSRL